MATKKQGQLTTSPEWAKHLRPLLKRWFWKGERRAEVDRLRYEIDAADPDSCHARSVEGLLQEVEGLARRIEESRVVGCLRANPEW